MTGSSYLDTPVLARDPWYTKEGQGPADFVASGPFSHCNLDTTASGYVVGRRLWSEKRRYNGVTDEGFRSPQVFGPRQKSS